MYGHWYILSAWVLFMFKLPLKSSHLHKQPALLPVDKRGHLGPDHHVGSVHHHVEEPAGGQLGLQVDHQFYKALTVVDTGQLYFT